MSRLLRNTAAHAAGQLVYPILSLVLVPFYLHRLGLAGYGVVAFLTLLVTLLGVFTRGLGSGLQREVARREAAAGDTLGGLVTAAERLYWGIGAALAIGVAVAGSLVQVDTGGVLDAAGYRACVVLVALRLAIALPSSAYQAIYLGLQQHVRMNALTSAIMIASAIDGALILLWWPSVVAFYASEVAHAAVGAWLLRRGAMSLVPAGPAGQVPRFDEVRGFVRVSLGLIWTNGLGLLISQCDRVAIVRALPVDALGIYNAATAGGRLIVLGYGPVVSAVYPHLCELVAASDQRGFADRLSRTARQVTVIAAGAGLPLAMFGAEILQLWTRHPEVVQRGAEAWLIYTLGNIGIGGGSVLYQGQIALGRSRFGAAFNTAAIVWYPPLVLWLVATRGLPGAAWAWTIYGGLAWIYHLAVSGHLMGARWAARTTAHAGVVLAGATAATMVSRSLATAWFPGSPAGRLAIAVTGGVLTTACLWLLDARRRAA